MNKKNESKGLSKLVHKFGYVFYATVREFPCTIVISSIARNLSRGGKTKRYLPSVDMTP
jgi:hypothetical protein